MRCRICDSKNAKVPDPRTGELLCYRCSSIIQEVTGKNWEVEGLTKDIPEPSEWFDDTSTLERQLVGDWPDVSK